MHPRQIKNRRDTSHEVIVRNHLFKAKQIEQPPPARFFNRPNMATRAAHVVQERNQLFELEGNRLLQQNLPLPNSCTAAKD